MEEAAEELTPTLQGYKSFYTLEQVADVFRVDLFQAMKIKYSAAMYALSAQKPKRDFEKRLMFLRSNKTK